MRGGLEDGANLHFALREQMLSVNELTFRLLASQAPWGPQETPLPTGKEGSAGVDSLP